MIRIMHTACAALLVMVALIAYGLKEETRALQREIRSVERETLRVEREIADLRTEWSYLDSPETLQRIAATLYGRDGFVGVDGAPLEPWRAEQVLDLAPPAPLPSANAIGPLLAEIERDLAADFRAVETATVAARRAAAPSVGAPDEQPMPGALPADAPEAGR